jgi:hypothetical protein
MFGPCVHIGPDEMISLNTKECGTDERSGVNPKTKGRVVIRRPRIEHWSLTFTLSFDEEWIPEETLCRNLPDVLEAAGKLIGILDYRPQKKGSFGMFEAVSIELLPAVKQAPKERIKIIGFDQPSKKAA